MNRKLNRVLDEIQRTEKKIAEWQEHMKELNMRRKQMEDAEIIKSVRSMKLDSRELLEVLDSIQNGTMDFRYGVPERAGEEQEGNLGTGHSLESVVMDRTRQPENMAEIKEDDNSENED